MILKMCRTLPSSEVITVLSSAVRSSCSLYPVIFKLDLLCSASIDSQNFCCSYTCLVRCSFSSFEYYTVLTAVKAPSVRVFGWTRKLITHIGHTQNRPTAKHFVLSKKKRVFYFARTRFDKAVTAHEARGLITRVYNTLVFMCQILRIIYTRQTVSRDHLPLT